MTQHTEDKIFAGNSKKRFALLEKYNKMNKVRNNFPKLPAVSNGELLKRRRENRHVRAYYAQTLDYMLERVENCQAVFGLLDTDGCMIRLKGNPDILRWLEEKGVCIGSMWNFNQIGTNAVAVGMRELVSMISIGEENYQNVLKDVAVYFSPLVLQNFGKKSFMGGIVILCHKKDQNDAFLLNTTCLAGNLMIRISMAYRTSASYDASDSRGMVLLDINIRNHMVTITHHNKIFFDILEIPRQSYRDTYFKPVEDIFDPLPYNKKFWEIVMNLEEVIDCELPLYIRGKKIDCIISTKPHRQENIKTKGILVYITTKERIAQQISEKTSNNAILSKVNIVGKSNIMRSRIKRAQLFARTDSNVMLLGESGVGKDIFAQAIHNMSERRAQPFVAVNCGALPRDLIASELFGYEGGAFTGAKKQGNIGKFELANGGTLFLDEIGELPLDLQATLLRAVEQKMFMRLGSNKMIHTDIKIICATNANIQAMIEEKKFRADLYYRLGNMQLYIPPLRERGEDVILLAEYFIKRIADRIGRKEKIILSEDAKAFLLSCPWYGNVRELQNVMDCVVQLYPDTIITADILMDNVNPAYASYTGTVKPIRYRQNQKNDPDEILTGSYSKKRIKISKEEILEALEKCGNNRTEAAKYLGISRKTLYRYFEKLEL